MRTRSILLWPFELLWGLARLLFWPALVLGVAWLVLPHAWFLLVAVAVGFFTVFVLRVWSTVVHGSMRTMARGTITVRNQTRRRSAPRRSASRRGGR
jgi:hypothetical protein